MVLLVVQPERVWGLRGIDVAPRSDHKGLSLSPPPSVRSSRVLEAVVPVESSRTRQDLRLVSRVMFDPNWSNKRKVERGSDPIHDRC
ncbi:hypothetical protein HRI_004164200 [Hibiscus trionum]|uniref:Uncharacterized protein n=1 Tax=Hibiscus trionum TaxID=183268 RepID=A0A9W7IZX6_HIBTR|nr:hypothetical protein HRI_004164200 [Hibiscus trionum]